MRIVNANKSWLAALAVAFCLVGAAVTMAQRDPVLPAPTAHDARELSSVFRHISQEALPSVVSIETIGKADQLVGDIEIPFDDEDSPFHDFFRDNPRLRENNPRGQMPLRRGTGSGFIIDPEGIIVTNTHVVRDAEEVRVKLHDGREFIASDIKTDPRTDVAIVRIDGGGNLPSIVLGDSDQMEIGDWVLAVGSPFGLDMTVTAGIISGKGRGPGINEREDYLQTDAAINPGNSGGPLLNLNGEVIGINTAISSRSGGSDGVAFTIPINMAKWVIGQLVDGGEVHRAYLGVMIQEVTSELADQFKTAIGQGVIVGQILPESPAADSDLQSGDVILELDGHKVTSPRQLQGIVERLEVDKEYQLQILRSGERMSIPITLRAMPQDALRSEPVEGDESSPEAPADESSFKDLGIDVRPLTPELAQQLDLESTGGVLITSVEPGSPAHRAGLAAGIVIEKVGNTPVTSPDEFAAALEKVSLEDGILMLVRSGNSTRFVVLKSK